MDVNILETKFPEVKIFIPKVHQDFRGFFCETYNNTVDEALGVKFVQDNHSMSKACVVRGLHYQWNQPMGKLLRVVKGSGTDVVVDIRKSSPKFGQHLKIKLSEKNGYVLWVPPGFAQGFCALENDTHLCYKTTSYHNSLAEGAINPRDETLSIDWQVPNAALILSKKDESAQSFSQYSLEPSF